MICQKCASDNCIKNGIIAGIQRFKREDSRYNFTTGRPSKSIHLKRLPLQLYLEGLGFRSIWRLLDVSFQNVANWIRNFGKILKENVKIESDFNIVEVDEIWNFIKKNWKQAL